MSSAGSAAARPRFAVLDSWRGLAALAVAVSHIHGSAPFLSGDLHGNLPLAVDFFFVLSGFVIAANYGARLSAGMRLLPYMALRIGRIWPLHAAMVLAYVVLEVLLALKGGGGMLPGRDAFTGARDPATLPAALLLLQAWIWPQRDLWNVQSWSVSVELGLYLLSALAWRLFGLRTTLLAVIPALLALVLLDLGLAPTWWQVLRGIGGFGLGMACWPLWQRFHAIRLPCTLVTGLELAAIPAILTGMALLAPYLAMDLLFAAVVLLFSREEGPVSRLLLRAPFVWLGTLSYALYMVHGLVIGRAFDVLAMVQARLGTQWVEAGLGGGDRLLLAPLPALIVAVAMLGVALLVAWPAWRLIEWPARQWSRRVVKR